MNQLDQIENRIKGIIEKNSDRLPWADKNAALVSRFCEALRLYLHENPDCFPDSACEFRIYMTSEECRMWKQQPDWQKVLNETFIATLVELSCKPALLPDVVLKSRNSLLDGEFAFSIETGNLEQEKTGVVSLSTSVKSSKPQEKSCFSHLLINLDSAIPMDKSVMDLGRKSTNDIVLDDMRVSRHHAQIRKTREGFMIFDVGSSGGTFINGERITSRLLKSGDVISLAGCSLVFTDEKDHENLEDSDEREITSDLSKPSTQGSPA